jgi:hypothetical protein
MDVESIQEIRKNKNDKGTKWKMSKIGKLTLGLWDSVVDIATGYGLDDRGVGVRVPVG